MRKDGQWRGLIDAFAARFPHLEIVDAWGDGLEVDVKVGDDPIDVIALAKGLLEELGETEFEVRLDSADLSKLRIACDLELEREDQDDVDQAEEPRPTDDGWGTLQTLTELPVNPGQGQTVLVVEGNADVLDIVVNGLVGSGYVANAASNARDAIQMLLAEPRIEVLFSEVVLLGGMNGVQLSAEAQRLRPGLKVVLTSGYPTSLLVQKYGLPEALELLPKPYNIKDLVDKLRLVIG